MRTAIHRIIRQPRRSAFYGLCALLVVLLLLFAINEKNWRPLKNKSNWKVTSNYSKAGAKFAIDKNLETYWTSYVPVTSGIFFQVDVGAPATINAILFDLGEQEGGHPVHWVVKTSLDGAQWQTVIPTRDIAYRSFFAIIFPAQENVRYLQVIHTSTTSKRIRWVISELDLFQPIVPWQFERSSLFFGIVGVLLAIVGGFMLTFSRTDSVRREYLVLSSLVLSVILIGWGLRVYDIGAYELSAPELQIASALNIEEARHSRWLSSYFQQTGSGVSACILLWIRWVYQLCQNYAVAIRTAPAIFSALTILLLGFLWKKQASEPSIEEFRNSPSLWELLFVIIGASLALVPILLSRRGELAVSLLFFLLSYLLAAYRFLYQQGGYGWLLLSALLLLIGYWVEPAMLIAPGGILLFESLRYMVKRFYGDSDPASQKSQLLRDGLYLLSVLPLYGFARAPLPALFVGSARIMLTEFLRTLQANGLSGAAIWVLAGCGCIGLIKMLSDRKLFEGFLVLQCLWCSLGTWCMTARPDGAALIFLYGLFWVGAKGLVTLLSAQPIFSARLSFSCKLSVSLMLATFLSVHTVNSLFTGNANFPYASSVFEQYRQEKGIQALIHTLLAESGDCSSVAAFDELMAEQYSTLYPLQLEFIEFPEAQRLARQGRFWPYLLLSERTPEAEVRHFLEQHYIPIERSASVILYKRQDQGCTLSQRYIWEDLYRKVGRHIEDKRAASQFVRVAKKGDPSGLLTFGPSFPMCCPGPYAARFVLRSAGGAPDDVVAYLKVAADSYHTLARLQLTGRDFPDHKIYYAFDLPFELDMTDNPAFQKKHLQYFVEVTGNAEVRLDYIELIPQF